MTPEEQRILLIVYKRDEDCTDEDRKIRVLEWQKSKAAFTYFLRYVKVIRPPTQEDAGGLIPLQMWPHLIEAIKILLSKKLLVWLKSRQVGASWLIASYVLWFSMTHFGTKILLFSRGEIEAMELLNKCYIIYNNLPDFMRLKQDPKSFTEMGFPVMSSSIKVLAATKNAGVGYAASILVCDEWQDHPFADENFFAAMPTIGAVKGGQFIGIFTQSGETLDTFANITFQEALANKNDFTYLFTGWKSVPGRTQVWYDAEKRRIPKENLRMLTPDLYMQRNYPASIEEALRPVQTSAAFNLSIIDDMMSEVRNPIEVLHDGIDSKIVKIYKGFMLGDYFIAATDTSHGLGLDFSVTVLMNVKTGEIVADIMNGVIPPEELALHSVRLLDIFKNPLWYIEANDYGGVTISTAQRLDYKNFGMQETRKELPGFLTGDNNRTLLWGDLIPAINNRQIIIHNRDGLKQFADVIRNVSKNGRIEAMAGRHDDYPMAVGIAWFKKGEVSTGTGKQEPIHSLTFGKNQWSRRWRK